MSRIGKKIIRGLREFNPKIHLAASGLGHADQPVTTGVW